MKLLNFTFDCLVCIESGKIYADLHNSYTFKGFKYDILKREVLLEWSIWSVGTDQPEKEPENISLLFKKVSLLKVKERDNGYRYTEDECVEIMGFIGNNDIEIMDGFLHEHPREGCEHFIMTLHSEAAIKISAETVELVK